MNANDLRMESPLEQKKASSGIDGMRQELRTAAQKDTEHAAALLNDRALSFPSLFQLIPVMEEFHLVKKLNPCAQTALALSGEILRNRRRQIPEDFPAIGNGGAIRQALQWMLNTGGSEDGFSRDFDMILDVAASILLKKYRDEDAIEAVVDLIFQRSRKGEFIHDLVWALFQSRNPYALKAIASYLLSREPEDVRLARELLHLDPPEESSGSRGTIQQYYRYLLWLNENYPFLYFTGEDYQLTSSPDPCKVDLNAKYLCRSILHQNKKPLRPSTEEERKELESFSQLNSEEKDLLSKFSQKLHDARPSYWEQWIRLPVSQQVGIAQKGLEGLQ